MPLTGTSNAIYLTVGTLPRGEGWEGRRRRGKREIKEAKKKDCPVRWWFERTTNICQRLINGLFKTVIKIYEIFGYFVRIFKINTAFLIRALFLFLCAFMTNKWPNCRRKKLCSLVSNLFICTALTYTYFYVCSFFQHFIFLFTDYLFSKVVVKAGAGAVRFRNIFLKLRRKLGQRKKLALVHKSTQL